MCVQSPIPGFYAIPELPQSEDCLTLNVWTAAPTVDVSYLELGTAPRLGSHLRMEQVAVLEGHYRQLLDGKTPEKDSE